jgi:hypothetical protein
MSPSPGRGSTRKRKSQAITWLVCVVVFAASVYGQSTKAANEYGSGFSFNNQLYTLQGAAVSLTTGMITRRPWMGAVAGVSSCLAYRAIHDRGYANDPLFSGNRVAFCAAGSAGGYVLNKVMHIRKKK